jgi:hypothetical protein
MRTTRVLAVTALLLALAAPAFAEHNGPPPREDAVAPEARGPDRPFLGRDLDVQIKLGRDGFRLGGRLFGPEGVAGAWLNGRFGRSGIVLDGRVQEPSGRSFNFKLDADILGLLW